MLRLLLVLALFAATAFALPQQAPLTTSLVEAVRNDNATMVRLLLESTGVNPNTVTYDGRSALIEACIVDADISIYNMLLENGADPAVQNKQNVTALHVCATRGHLYSLATMALYVPIGVLFSGDYENSPFELYVMYFVSEITGDTADANSDLFQTVRSSEGIARVKRPVFGISGIYQTHRRYNRLFARASEEGSRLILSRCVRCMLAAPLPVMIALFSPQHRSAHDSTTPLMRIAVSGVRETVDMPTKENIETNIASLAGAVLVGSKAAQCAVDDLHRAATRVIETAVSAFVANGASIANIYTQFMANVGSWQTGVNVRAADGDTALIIAARAGRADAVSHLLRMPTVNTCAKSIGKTAAQFAATKSIAAAIGAYNTQRGIKCT